MQLAEAHMSQIEARQRIREQIPRSYEYWDFCMQEIESWKEIRDIYWIGQRRMFANTNDPDYKEAERIYGADCDDMEIKYEMAQRRRKRQEMMRAMRFFMLRMGHCHSLRNIYVQLLLDLTEKVSRRKSPYFIRNLMRTHEVLQSSWGNVVWSPVLGNWINQEHAEAGHIIPPAIAETAMVHIFGINGAKELNSAKNGMWFPRGVEAEYNRFGLVIVPANTNEKAPREWKILIVKGGLWNPITTFDTTFSELHEKTLIFENNEQPRARYFYFRYILAMVHLSRAARYARMTDAQKLGVPEGSSTVCPPPPDGMRPDLGVPRPTVKLRSEKPDMTVAELAKAWVPRGQYIRESVLWALVEQIGPEELSDKEKQRILRSSIPGEEENEVVQLAGSLEDMDLISHYGGDDR